MPRPADPPGAVLPQTAFLGGFAAIPVVWRGHEQKMPMEKDGVRCNKGLLPRILWV
jgi:hypothetical protein